MESFNDSPLEWENELEEDNENEKWVVKQNIMFLIDASKPMFNTFNNKNFFSTSIEICKAVVMKLIRMNRNDKIGVMLFGTNDNNKTCPNNINILCQIKKPGIHTINILDDVMLSDLTRYGQSQFLPLADALWYSNYLIKKCDENQSRSSIILITCNDQPMIGDSKKQFNLRKRLDDVIKNDIDFKFIPLGATFNMNIFYEKILNKFNNITIPSNGLKNIDDIMSEINEKMKHGRSVSKIKFFIDNNNFICTSIYNFYTKSKIPSKVKLDKNTNKPLKSMSQIFTTDTNELVCTSDLGKYCIIAQRTIVFKSEDLPILKSSIIEPGTIKLLGFTNKENILILYHFKTSSFIQPDNVSLEGSSLFFNSLLECCLEMNKIIICFLKIRKGGRGHLVALLPQTEILDDYGTQKYPPGFHVIYLPFSDCIRTIKTQEPNYSLPKITEQQINIAKNICEKLSFDYYPAIIKNPKINCHWAMLEALALELEAPNVTDETLPTNFIGNKLNLIKNDIYEYLFPKHNNILKTPVAKKRVPSTSHDNKRALKKQK
ncbi:X-ray repair cross-complementing protein 6-like [Sipha flava]|uniref:X-ray repair cross-complementing protein 5 n=1 Tax=Sipha flava TaxID=143950 RepID=A0A2S2QE73_9HEMI|nr:X-ray repair cross-complementing protein 6-like [Sipha flava]XP_025407528.1 X-ray repair cross-complementing protein 6-like [Sipha flava]